MARGVKKKDYERLEDSNISNVIKLLGADEPITKKEAVTKGPAFKNNYFDGANTLWKPHLVVENKYNRCLIYDGTYFHAPTVSSFGNNKETGRLTQIGFWQSEK